MREHPSKKGKPQIVLVDHGLYKTLDRDFQDAYARLWKGIAMANIPDIKASCEQLGVRKMVNPSPRRGSTCIRAKALIFFRFSFGQYPLLASMLTSRPFDEVIERSRTQSLEATSGGNDGGDKAVIRGYAQRYLKDIIAMLDIVPRQMLLIFKLNDCLRHVDMALGSPVNTLAVAGKYASRRVFESDRRKQRESNGGVLGLLQAWLSYARVLFRISGYEILSRLEMMRHTRELK